jgi:hypothetical protein
MVLKLKSRSYKRNWLVMESFDLYIKAITKIITNLKPQKIFTAERAKKATEQAGVFSSGLKNRNLKSATQQMMPRA